MTDIVKRPNETFNSIKSVPYHLMLSNKTELFTLKSAKMKNAVIYAHRYLDAAICDIFWLHVRVSENLEQKK